jgi:hypothetical protein
VFLRYGEWLPPFLVGRLEMLLPFCSQPNHLIVDVVKQLNGDIYMVLMPNDNVQQRGSTTADRYRDQRAAHRPAPPSAVSLRSAAPSLRPMYHPDTRLNIDPVGPILKSHGHEPTGYEVASTPREGHPGPFLPLPERAPHLHRP